MSAAHPGPDGRPRCRWCLGVAEFLPYHDTEWGFPVADDRRLFEKLSLEAFQSGLSWRTILAKRENFRAAFQGFDFERVARFGARDVERLLQDGGIVRPTAFAFMQAMGLINDHAEGCFVRDQVTRARRKFTVPL